MHFRVKHFSEVPCIDILQSLCVYTCDSNKLKIVEQIIWQETTAEVKYALNNEIHL